MKKILTGALIFISILNFAFANCETLDCAIENLLPHLSAVEDVIGTIAYISGVFFVYKSIMKFKENNESKGQVKLTSAILYFLAGGLLLGLPSVISMGRSTLSINGSHDQNQTTY